MTGNTQLIVPENSGPLFPTEQHLMSEIFSHLQIPDLINSCLSVCKEWHEVINRTDFWDSFVIRVLQKNQNIFLFFFGDVVSTIAEKLFRHPVPVWPYRRKYEVPLALMAKNTNRLDFELLKKRPDLAAICYQKDFKAECGRRVIEIAADPTFDSDTRIGMIRTILANGAMGDSERGQAVYKAAQEGQSGLVEVLLRTGAITDRDRSYSVRTFVRQGNLGAVKLLLKSGPFEEDKYDLRGETVVEATELGYFDIADALLKHGSVTGGYALSAFTQAAKDGELRIAKLLAPHLPWKTIALSAVVIHAVGVSNIIKVGLGIKGLLHVLQPVFA